MMTPFKPNPQQLEALLAGASKLWIPLPSDIIDVSQEGGMITWTQYGKISTGYIEVFLLIYSELQPGEQYFVQESATYLEDGTVLYREWENNSNQMTEQQSRYKFTAMAIEVKQVQDIDDHCSVVALGTPEDYCSKYMEEHNGERTHVWDWLEHWHDSQYPDQPYSSNPHGFLVNIERI